MDATAAYTADAFASQPTTGTGASPEPPRPKPVPIVPVPDDAPPCRFRHPRHGAPVQAWEYRDVAGRLVGHAARFEWWDEAGALRKDVAPLAFCELGDGRRGWRMRGLPEPRPLYRLPELLADPSRPVLAVEG
jgi:hypothetical protein